MGNMWNPRLGRPAPPEALSLTFVEWVGETVPHSFWAKAFYDIRSAKGTPCQVIVHALALSGAAATTANPTTKLVTRWPSRKRHSSIIAMHECNAVLCST